MDSSLIESTLTLIAALLLLVGVFGTIFPILPGSMLVILTLIGWALLVGGTPVWIAAGAGIVLAMIGMSASLVLTGRKMRAQQIPNGPVIFGAVVGVVGMFVIPVVGLFLGFAVGLLVAELVRRREFGAAVRSSWEACKSLGLGMVIEFACACLAAFSFGVGALVHFLS